MKNIKRIIIIFTMVVSTTFMFAENTDYKLHLEKAKEYESQKKWVYALSEYYDAMLAEPSIQAEEAYNSYMQLADTMKATGLKKGNPGYGEFDEFEAYDAWVGLIKEYERFWTEHCPWCFNISFGDKSVNIEERTASYKISILLKISTKFLILENVIIGEYPFNNYSLGMTYFPFINLQQHPSIYNKENISDFFS